MTNGKKTALVTGVGRAAGIGAGVVRRLAEQGWATAATYWRPYDDRMPWGRDEGVKEADLAIEADLSDPEAPARIFDEVESSLGTVTALVMCHCESVDSSIMTTTVESFDLHFAVNARATWLLIKEYGTRHAVPFGEGRIIAFTSDHTVHNLPYGASKGALDRITLAAAYELAELGVTANVINPGPNDTGWMDDELKGHIVQATPLRRLGTPKDSADLVSFLCSEEGGWINGQLIKSDGGFTWKW